LQTRPQSFNDKGANITDQVKILHKLRICHCVDKKRKKERNANNKNKAYIENKQKMKKQQQANVKALLFTQF